MTPTPSGRCESRHHSKRQCRRGTGHVGAHRWWAMHSEDRLAWGDPVPAPHSKPVPVPRPRARMRTYDWAAWRKVPAELQKRHEVILGHFDLDRECFSKRRRRA